MSDQLSNTILMIRPVAFHRNEETAENNYYQKLIEGSSDDQLQGQALKEFDGFVDKLRASKVNVVVIADTVEPSTPDSIFPNNWVSFHDDGDIYLFPMYAENRRLERRDEIIEKLREGFQVGDVHSMAEWENKEKYLEGTGSLILDRENRIAYAAISERTDPDLVEEFCAARSFTPCMFHAYQSVGDERKLIYHTNVMMCVGEKFVVICLDTIDEEEERQKVISSFKATSKEIIAITEEQNNHFAGNMLQVKNTGEERFVVMSGAAYRSLHQDQISALEKHGKIIWSDINTIETLGGGSARCMMAEVFLPKKSNN